MPASSKFLFWSVRGDKQPRYKQFPAVGDFSFKFSIVPSSKTTDKIKNVKRVQNGTDLLYHYADSRSTTCKTFANLR